MAELYIKIIPFFPPVKVSKVKWISQLNGIFKKLGKPSKEDIMKFASKERTKDILKFHSFEKMEINSLFPNIKNENVLDLLTKLLCIKPQAINHPYFEVIKEFHNEDDFNFDNNDEYFVNEYKQKIDKMEKKNALFHEQILFYKNEILSKQQNFQST